MMDAEVDESGRHFSHIARTLLSEAMRMLEQHQRRRQEREGRAEQQAREEARRLDEQLAAHRRMAEAQFTRLEQPGVIERLSETEMLSHWQTAATWAHESDRARGARDALEDAAQHRLGHDLRAIRQQWEADQVRDTFGQPSEREQMGERGASEAADAGVADTKADAATSQARDDFDSATARADRFAVWDAAGDPEAASARKSADMGQSRPLAEVLGEKAAQSGKKNAMNGRGSTAGRRKGKAASHELSR